MRHGMRYSAEGEHEFTDIRLVPDVVVMTFTHADLVANAYSVPAPPGTIVMGVGLEIIEAFTGGTSAIIGDGTDDDAFLKMGIVNPTTVGAFAHGMGTDAAFAQGKAFSAMGQMVVTLAGTITAGEGKLHIWAYSRMGNWRQPDV
jgi:hypothetical protein